MVLVLAVRVLEVEQPRQEKFSIFASRVRRALLAAEQDAWPLAARRMGTRAAHCVWARAIRPAWFLAVAAERPEPEAVGAAVRIEVERLGLGVRPRPGAVEAEAQLAVRPVVVRIVGPAVPVGAQPVGQAMARPVVAERVAAPLAAEPVGPGTVEQGIAEPEVSPEVERAGQDIAEQGIAEQEVLPEVEPAGQGIAGRETVGPEVPAAVVPAAVVPAVVVPAAVTRIAEAVVRLARESLAVAGCPADTPERPAQWAAPPVVPEQNLGPTAAHRAGPTACPARPAGRLPAPA